MMKKTHMVLTAVSLPLFLTSCMTTPSGSGSTAPSQGSIMVNELVSICGAMVGGQAEQRINQEWAKYPAAEVNRPMVELVANVLLSNPEAPLTERASQYEQYMSCATGLFVTNGQ